MLNLPNLSRIFPRVWDISGKGFVAFSSGMTSGFNRLRGRFFLTTCQTIPVYLVQKTFRTDITTRTKYNSTQ